MAQLCESRERVFSEVTECAYRLRGATSAGAVNGTIGSWTVQVPFSGGITNGAGRMTEKTARKAASSVIFEVSPDLLMHANEDRRTAQYVFSLAARLGIALHPARSRTVTRPTTPRVVRALAVQRP